MTDRSISVVIPAYNEEKRLGPTLVKTAEYLQRRFPNFEIIVVDDGSSDKTADLVNETASKFSGINLIRNARNSGKGFSIRRGVLSSRGDLVLTSDADMSTPVEELEKLLPFIAGGYDIAIGSRGLKESELLQRQPWYRERMGKTFNAIVRTLLSTRIRDTQCGFKLFKGDAARRLFSLSRMRGFSFDAEVLFIADRLRMKTREVPIRWHDSPASRVRLLRDSSRMLMDVFLIRTNWMRGLYKT